MLKNIFIIFLGMLILGKPIICFAGPAKSNRKHQIPIKASVVVDTRSGRVLHSYNSKVKIHPASITKWMTLYIAFEEIAAGKLSLNQKLYVSEHAASKPPCKLGIASGDYISVKSAISSLIVGSHNDTAAILAEAIAGSEAKFAKLMTRTAKLLGMKDTEFRNASGLHHDRQQTTALDLVKLAMAMRRDHREFYPLLAQTSFKFRGKTYQGHNNVMKTYKYAKASKTGFTNISGYNLITHAATKNKDIVAVVIGSKTAILRNNQMVALLDKHLGVKSIKLAAAVKPLNKRKAPIKVAALNGAKRRAN